MPATAPATEASRDVPGVGLIEYRETSRSRTYHLTPPDAKRRQRLPSVTTVLRATWPKPSLMRWYAKHGDDAERQLELAATRGTAVHAFIESYLTGGDIVLPEDPSLDGYIQGAARFLAEYLPEPEEIELLVAHPEMRYAGRLDLRAKIHGRRAIVDYKTSPRGVIYPEAHVQTLAYALADVECGAPPAERLYIVAIAADGRFNVADSHADLALWRNLRQTYDQIENLTKLTDADEQRWAATA